MRIAPVAVLLGALALASPTQSPATQAAALPAAPAPVLGQNDSFTFAAAGDLDGPGTAQLSKLGDALKSSGAAFFLALGDLGYTSSERRWCEAIKARFNDVEIIAGNHDTPENGPGHMSRYAQACPFTLTGVALVGGPKTPGYGYEYYFDYPAGKPLARFIMLSPGIEGELNYRFTTKSSHYAFAAQAIDGAKRTGIPWVIAGMHKNCLTTGTGHTHCETGTDLQNLFFSARVDLVLNAHEHNYERSKQLTCAPSRYQPSCVANAGPAYVRGAGVVVVTQGTGSDFYPVTNPLNRYYAAAQATDAGFMKFVVSPSRVTATFVSVTGKYSDTFTISGAGR
jgi:hypothetical protein